MTMEIKTPAYRSDRGIERKRPVIVCLGDSITSYSNSASGAPTSLVYNGDMTATIAFSSDIGFRAGDSIGVQGCTDNAYETLGTPILSVSGNAYTYAVTSVPTISPDPGVAGISAMYPLRRSPAGYMAWLDCLTGKNLTFINAGQGGDTVARCLARFDIDVASYNPDRVILSIGTNDVFGQSLTLDQMIPDIILIHEKCKAIGAQLDLLTPFPQSASRANWSSGRRDVYIALRKWMLRYAHNNGLLAWDWAAGAAGSVQCQDPTSANAAAAASVIQSDNIHSNCNGAYLGAKLIAASYNNIYGTSSKNDGAARCVTDGGLLANPILAGTGGTKTNGTGTVSGSVADGFEATLTAGAATLACSKVARTVANDGDIAGDWQRLTFTAAGANNEARFRPLTSIHSSLSNGDIVRCSCLVRIFSGASLINDINLFVNSQTATTGNLQVFDMAGASAHKAAFLEDGMIYTLSFDAPVRTPSSVHGAPSAFTPVLVISSAAAGAPVIDTALWSFEKVTNP